MEEKKLTDEEIVKALEHCSIWKCVGCTHEKDPFDIDDCRNNALRNALDLIHRLQGEKSEYERKLSDGELVSKDWHDEQVGHAELVIEEQKAEIERLTEENEYLDGCAKQFLADYQKCEIANTELQELNAKYYNEAKDLRRELKRVRKETAEKIAERLKAKIREQEERFASENHRLEEKLPKLKYERDIPIAKSQADKASGQATMANKVEFYIDEICKEITEGYKPKGQAR